MNKYFQIIPLICFTILFTSCNQQKTVKLFDGKTLNGWEGDPKVWRVENETIIGGSLETPLDHSYYLGTEEQYDDFHLKLKVKIIDKDSVGNAGVSFRAKRVPNSMEVASYQADLGYEKAKAITNFSELNLKDSTQKYPLWGSLVDESRDDHFRYPKPNWFPVVFLQIPEREKVENLIKLNDWNEYEIIAIDQHIQIKLNGVKTVDFVETAKVADVGNIFLQVHKGNPFEVHYKDIEITTF